MSVINFKDGVQVQPSQTDIDDFNARLAANNSLSAKKAKLKAKLSALAAEKRQAGVTINGISVPTKDSSVALITAAKMLDDDTVDFVTDETSVQLTRAEFNAIYTAVLTYGQGCFSRRKTLDDAITNAADATALNAINITTGWPSQTITT